MVIRLGWVFHCRKMPDQEFPLAPYRCRYLERYYNRMVKEKEAAAKKQKKKEEKEKKQEKLLPCLYMHLLARSYLTDKAARAEGPEDQKVLGLRVSGDCDFPLCLFLFRFLQNCTGVGVWVGTGNTSLVLFCALPTALWSRLMSSYGGSSLPPGPSAEDAAWEGPAGGSSLFSRP